MGTNGHCFPLFLNNFESVCILKLYKSFLHVNFIFLQALVRMDRHIPYAQRMRRVNEVIQEVSIFYQPKQSRFWAKVPFTKTINYS